MNREKLLKVKQLADSIAEFIPPETGALDAIAALSAVLVQACKNVNMSQTDCLILMCKMINTLYEIEETC
jgi:hypothetical protein